MLRALPLAHTCCPFATTPGSELAEVQPDLEALAAELPSYSAAVQCWVLRDGACLSLLGLGTCGMACLATCRTLYSLLTLIQHGSLRLSDAAWTRLLTAAGKLGASWCRGCCWPEPQFEAMRPKRACPNALPSPLHRPLPPGMPLQVVPMLLAQYVKADMEPHVLDKFGAMIDSTVKPLQVRYGSGRSTPPLLLHPAMEASAAPCYWRAPSTLHSKGALSLGFGQRDVTMVALLFAALCCRSAC